MQQELHHLRFKAWGLLGISVMAMSAAFFLHEGQAGIWAAPPPHHSIPLESTSGIRAKYTALKKDVISPMTTLYPESGLDALENDAEERLNKKKFGLAILFLGVLADKS